MTDFNKRIEELAKSYDQHGHCDLEIAFIAGANAARELMHEIYEENINLKAMLQAMKNKLSSVYCYGLEEHMVRNEGLQEKLNVAAKQLKESCYCDEGWYRSTEPCGNCKALNKIKGGSDE